MDKVEKIKAEIERRINLHKKALRKSRNDVIRRQLLEGSLGAYESLLQFANGLSKENIKEVTRSNGSTDSDIEDYNPYDDFRKSDGENKPTEFEEALANLVGHYRVCKSSPETDFTDIEFSQEYAQDLLRIARKQIAEEINVDELEKSLGGSSKALTCSDCFKIGAKAVINKLKKG